MQIRLFIYLGSLILILASVNAQEKPPVQETLNTLVPLPEHSKALFITYAYLEKYHYRKLKLNDSLSAVVFANYIDDLDPSKVFFLQSDLDYFEKYKFQLDDELSAQKLDFGFQLFNLYQSRVLDQYARIPEVLEKGFDYEKEEYYDLDFDKINWASSTEELNERWRLIVKSRALNLLLAKKDWYEVKEILLDRNKRRIKSLYQNKSEDVFQVYLNALTSAYDPHTSYFSPITSDNFQINMSLSLEGIGAVLGQQLDYTQIVSVVPGGPAFKSKRIFEKDKVIAVAQGDDGEFVDVVGWRLDEVVQKIRGPKGTVVRLQTLSKGDLTALPDTVRMIREKIKLEDESAKGEIISYSEDELNYRVGVITLPSFYIDFEERSAGIQNYKSTTRDVSILLDSLNKLEMDALVIDLRYNGGGSLDEAIDLTGLFIPSGPVVQVRNTDKSIDILSDNNPRVLYSGPLAVLENRYSASASEIFAAAIQDYKRGVVFGENSFGKGTVQSLLGLERPVLNYLNRLISVNQFSNNDELKILRDKVKSKEISLGQLKMTLAKFYRASGSSTQRTGVRPDIAFPSYFTSDEVGESSSPSALPWDEIVSSNFSSTNDVSSDLLDDLYYGYQKHLAEDRQLIDLVNDINEQRAANKDKSISLNLSMRQREAEVNESSKNLDEELVKTELSFGESDRVKISKDPYLKESIRLMAQWVKRSN
ncbi:MAG: tail-specific protease [Flammeovirgaceae bacterium]|nr:tail-specific protease [Flammeovirgaceae bacterium]